MTRLILVSLLVVAATCCRTDVVLGLSPSSQTVPLGSQATLSLDISGLGNGTSLGTYDVNVSFDPTLLSYSGIAFGNQVDISGLGDIQSITPGIGTVDVFELSLDSPAQLNTLQAPAFTLATLTFNTLAPTGNSLVTFSVNALGDAFGNSISATLQNSSLSIGNATTVPEAKSLWLVLCALAVLPLAQSLPKNGGR